MMETIRIRRAGYPIRHHFSEFVDRYRMLVDGIGPSHKVDCKAASQKICDGVLKNTDYQLGKTKVFLKVSILLEFILLKICSCKNYLETCHKFLGSFFLYILAMKINTYKSLFAGQILDFTMLCSLIISNLFGVFRVIIENKSYLYIDLKPLYSFTL